MPTTKTRGRATPALPRVSALLVALAVPLAGCDLNKLLDVPDPAVATPGALEGPQSLPILLAGAQTDFQTAFSGSSGWEGMVNMTGLFTDELHYTSTFPTRVQVDRREITPDNGTMETIHRNLQRARASADRSARTYAQHGPNALGHAEALNLHGFSVILLGENYCSGVPFSTLTAAGATEFGQPLTTEQMFQTALTSFDQALAVATQAGSAAAAVQQQNLARVGRARALLNLGRFADAAAAAQDVPTSFVYRVFHSENSARQHNAAFSFMYLERRWSVADREGGGLPFRSDNDPRVPWARGTGAQAAGFDESPLYLQLKYTNRSASVILASGIEARLIQAEAALEAGQANWLTILNDLRANPPAEAFPAAQYPGIGGLAPLANPGTQAARVDMLFKERAYWMYLTAHRLGDARRLMRQYGRTQEQAFPTGEWGVWIAAKSGEYGSDVNFPIPLDEENNPHFTQCLDRNP